MMDNLPNSSEPDGFLEDSYHNSESHSPSLEVNSKMEKVIRQSSVKSWSAASSSEENSSTGVLK